MARPGGLFDEAVACEDSGRPDEALLKWREAVAADPSALALCRLGGLASSLGETREAEETLLRSIAAAPAWSLPLDLIALLYRAQGRLPEAEACLRRSLALQVRARTLTILGDVLDRQDRAEEARAVLLQAIGIDDAQEESYFLLARATRDDREERIRLYRRALELDPEYFLAHRDLGWEYRSLGRLEEAEAHIRAALALQSTDVWSYVYLGNTLWAGGREQEAEVAFRLAMAASPGDGLPLWCLAGLVREKGRFGEARQLLRQAFRSNAFDIEAIVEYALLLKETGQSRRARAYLRRAAGLDPSNRRVIELLTALAE
jgi:tetratricopeptide (TPR) repeat protein